MKDAAKLYAKHATKTAYIAGGAMKKPSEYVGALMGIPKKKK